MVRLPAAPVPAGADGDHATRIPPFGQAHPAVQELRGQLARVALNALVVGDEPLHRRAPDAAPAVPLDVDRIGGAGVPALAVPAQVGVGAAAVVHLHVLQAEKQILLRAVVQGGRLRPASRFALVHPLLRLQVNAVVGPVAVDLPRLVVAAAVARVDDVGAVDLWHAATHGEVGAHRRVGLQFRHLLQHRRAEPELPPGVEYILAIHEQQLHRLPPRRIVPRMSWIGTSRDGITPDRLSRSLSLDYPPRHDKRAA